MPRVKKDPWGPLAKPIAKTPDEIADRLEDVFYKLQAIVTLSLYPQWTISFNSDECNSLYIAFEEFYSVKSGTKAFYFRAEDVLRKIRRAFNRWHYGITSPERVEQWTAFLRFMMEGSADDSERRLWEGELQRGW